MAEPDADEEAEAVDDELEPPPLLPQAAASSASGTAAAAYTKRIRLVTRGYSFN
jgi:hypothetical protein